jgi:cell division septation protein DedD
MEATMLMKGFIRILPLAGLLLLACSSSDELSGTEQTGNEADRSFQRVDDGDEPVIPETDEPVRLEIVEDEDVPGTERPVPVRVEASGQPAQPAVQDASPEVATPATQPHGGSMMWSVQIGAFKTESGAFTLVEEAKKKFNQPVYKRYDPVTGFYKVTLGSFPVREQAADFKAEVQSRGYPDAFTVEVAR